MLDFVASDESECRFLTPNVDYILLRLTGFNLKGGNLEQSNTTPHSGPWDEENNPLKSLQIHAEDSKSRAAHETAYHLSGVPLWASDCCLSTDKPKRHFVSILFVIMTSLVGLLVRFYSHN